MFSIAYRMLGSAAEAEDVVQEAFLRFHRESEEGAADIENPKAWLSTVTTRLSIDQLQSARARRESYVGTWLPEPLLSDPAPGPAERAEMSDSLSLAFLVLLESLSPVERAVFLLREVFGYDYAEIARSVDKSEANCRQIFTRARRHIDQGRPRFEASRRQGTELTERFLAALSGGGDIEAFIDLLAPDVVMYGDGGGKGPAVRQPVTGALRVARFLAGLVRQARRYGLRLEPVVVNGSPGMQVLDPDGRLLDVLSVDLRDGLVAEVRSILNPDKLRHLGPVGNAAELLGSPPQPGGNAR
jgi:RNA polymerase sigma-70 factor (TIGR02957 family)